MHELSIAMSIVDVVAEEATRRQARVDAVHLKVGVLSGVVADALQFSYEMACKDTSLQGSRLVIEEIPIVVFCSRCQAERTLESMQLFCCPECGTPSGDLRHGKELEVVALEIQ
jgi:hydrogenase nickel incorporation protein HypA/HybF